MVRVGAGEGNDSQTCGLSGKGTNLLTPALLPTGYVTLDNSLHLSEPQFPHLYSERGHIYPQEARKSL